MIATDLPVRPQAMKPAARVARLTLTDFRNYAQARLEPGPQPVVLTGANGAGKTNLLEALSFLSPGRRMPGGRIGRCRIASAMRAGPRPVCGGRPSSSQCSRQPRL